MEAAKIGAQFKHRRVLDQNNLPMVYRVTRMMRGYVYYKPVDGGKSECCPIEDFCKIAMIGAA
jgi:hypothetical protein